MYSTSSGRGFLPLVTAAHEISPSYSCKSNPVVVVAYTHPWLLRTYRIGMFLCRFKLKFHSFRSHNIILKSCILLGDGRSTVTKRSLLPPATVVNGKVMFSQMSVNLSGMGGWVSLVLCPFWGGWVSLVPGPFWGVWPWRMRRGWVCPGGGCVWCGWVPMSSLDMG